MKNYSPVLNPNLPQGNVRVVAIGESYLPIVNDPFKRLGIEIVPIPLCDKVDARVSGHADLTTHHLRANDIMVSADTYSGTYNNLKIVCNKFGLQMWNIFTGGSKLRTKYPGDVPLNALRIGQFLFCNTTHTDVRLLRYCEENGIETVHVNQGYARCSVCIVQENAAITADPGLAEAMEQKEIDVLRIHQGYIELPGFEYGFIGGASGKISHDKLCFTGTLKSHPDIYSIERFLDKHGVKLIELTKEACLDIGSIIPLIETID